MKAKRDENFDAPAPKHYAALCEPALAERCIYWGPAKRRRMARVFERWAAQLCWSADLIERYEEKGGTVPLDAADVKLLATAAQLEAQAGALREIVNKPEPRVVATERALVQALN